MKFSDYGHEELWNVAIVHRGGDYDPEWQITRQFFIAEQSETQYLFQFIPSVMHEIADNIYRDEYHWSDGPRN